MSSIFTFLTGVCIYGALYTLQTKYVTHQNTTNPTFMAVTQSMKTEYPRSILHGNWVNVQVYNRSKKCS
jgi:hypothetical protein